MNLVAIDEYGEFENSGDKTKYIAGIMYEGEESDIARERKRINAYLKAVCRDAETIFPRDLHVDYEGTNKKYVAETKKRIAETLAEFLQFGTYEKCPLKDDFGKEFSKEEKHYNIVAIVKSNSGKKDLVSEKANIMVRDNYASNLYLHMMEDLLMALLFYSPVEKKNQPIKLEIASRTLPEDKLSAAQKKEFKELGIAGNAAGFKEANTDTYRTLIQRELLKSELLYSDIQLEVSSIQYETESDSMAFLYLADIVCGELHEKASLTDKERIQVINNKAYNITGQKPFVKGYDDIDILFEKACYKKEAGDYLGVLELQYEAEHSDSGFCAYYLNHWFKTLTDRIIEDKNTAAIKRAAEELYSSTLRNNIDLAKLNYMFGKLENIFKKCEPGVVSDYAWFYLNAAGAASWNHLGLPEKARKCFKENEKYAEHIPIEDLIRWRNRWSVTCCDRFDFDQAVRETEKTLYIAEICGELRKDCFADKKPSKLIGLAKSQYGQCLAYKKDPEAENQFKEALDIFENNSPDYCISLSYLLHYYLEAGKKKEYEKYASVYFGSNNLEEQFRSICESDRDSRFQFCIFVKACWLFYKNELPQSVLKAFRDIDRALERNKEGQRLLGHPWELSKKYLLFFSADNKWNDSAKRYLDDLIDISSRSKDIIGYISEFGIIQYYDKKKDTGKKDIKVRDLFSKMSAITPEADKTFKNDIEKYDWLKGKFTYTFV